jgi:hypothetical protein
MLYNYTNIQNCKSNNRFRVYEMDTCRYADYPLKAQGSSRRYDVVTTEAKVEVEVFANFVCGGGSEMAGDIHLSDACEFVRAQPYIHMVSADVQYTNGSGGTSSGYACVQVYIYRYCMCMCACV